MSTITFALLNFAFGQFPGLSLILHVTMSCFHLFKYHLQSNWKNICVSFLSAFTDREYHGVVQCSTVRTLQKNHKHPYNFTNVQYFRTQRKCAANTIILEGKNLQRPHLARQVSIQRSIILNVCVRVLHKFYRERPQLLNDSSNYHELSAKWCYSTLLQSALRIVKRKVSHLYG